ncbi:MAG: hypothetical protein GY803_00615 [Chloroflexi bacterium]|nr:hypothetical protein [Chloroflexota bacterium]
MMLQNGNFSGGWETLPAIIEANYLKNQRPNGWQIEWLSVGEPLYDDPNSKSGGIPECVHKLSRQLPPNEQLDGKNALILSGDAVYKVFSATAPFGATLSQAVTGLQPGSKATLIAPVQVHLHGETDAYAAESGVWVNDEGGWVNGSDMGDRKWHKHKITFIVPEDGIAEIIIRVKSKWARGKDFFFDGVTLEAQAAEPNGNGETAPQVVYVQLPEGFTLSRVVSDVSSVVQVAAPAGVEVKLVE